MTEKSSQVFTLPKDKHVHTFNTHKKVQESLRSTPDTFRLPESHHSKLTLTATCRKAGNGLPTDAPFGNAIITSEVRKGRVL